MNHAEMGFLRINEGRMEWTATRETMSLEQMQEHAAPFSNRIEVHALGKFGGNAKNGVAVEVRVLAVFDEEFAYVDSARPTMFDPRHGHVLCGPVVLCEDDPHKEGLSPIPLASALAVFGTGLMVLIPDGVDAKKPEPEIRVVDLDPGKVPGRNGGAS